jgi:hypothetical protein
MQCRSRPADRIVCDFRVVAFELDKYLEFHKPPRAFMLLRTACRFSLAA